MTMTLTNYRIGAGQVLFNGTDIGATKGGIELTVEQQQVAVNADQFSEVLLDEVVNGKKATLKCSFYQTDITNLTNAMHTLTLAGSTNKQVPISLNIGTGLLTNAHALYIKRMSNETTVNASEHEWYYFPKAFPVGPVVEKYSWDGQSVYEVEFHIYPGEMYRESGTGTGTLNTMTDSAKTWVTNAWQNKYVISSAGVSYLIASNNATALTVSGTPASGAYTINDYATPQYGLGRRGYGVIDAW